MSKVLVTGGAGFIGSHVVENFLAQGDEVAVVDNLETGELSNLPKINLDRFTFKECSVLSKDANDFIMDFRPDTVVHLAAQMNVRRSVAEPIFDAEQNIIGMISLLEVSKKIGVDNFIFSSTGGAIYGEQEYFPADESHPINPECPYGLSKNCAELYIKYYSQSLKKENPKFKAVAFRFGNVYGPRQNPKGEAGVVAIFSKKILAGESLKINGDGNQTRDFIFVGDVVDAILKFHKSSSTVTETFSVFNLGTGIETNINQIAAELNRICVEKLARETVEIIHGPQAPGEQFRSLLDANSFSLAMSWQPKIEIAKGLELTLESFLKNS